MFDDSCTLPDLAGVPSLGGPAMADEELEALALALRDFFLAPGEERLAAAGRALGEAFGRLPGSGAKSDEYPAWPAEGREAEYEFNRLFVGPGPVPAPLYASVYLDPEPQLMGEATADIRALMRELGLGVPHEGSEPEDHLGFELELWCVLGRLMRTHSPEALAGKAVAEARRWLEHEHLGRWIPEFIKRARAAEPAPVLGMPLHCLEQWLQQCLERSVYEQE